MRLVLATLCLLVIAVTSAIAYSTYQTNKHIRFNEQYHALLTTLVADDVKAATEHFAIIKSFGDAKQFTFAALLLAQAYFKDERYEDAKELYGEITANSDREILRDLARIRQAKVHMALQEHNEALATLAELESPSSYTFLVSESLTGDIHLLSGNLDNASFAYSRALAEARQLQTPEYISLLEIKVQSLASLRLQRGVAPTASNNTEQ